MNLISLDLLYNFILFIVFYSFRTCSGLIKNRLSQRDFLCLFLAFIPLIILHAFKKPSSLKDLQVYQSAFEEVGTMTWCNLFSQGFVINFSMEPGYVFLNRLVYSVSENVSFLFLIIALILLAAYAISIKNYSNNISLSIFLFVIGPFCQSLFVLRQHLAIAIMLFTIPYIINRNLKRYLIIFFIAFSIHYTTFVLLPLYFLYGIQSKKKLVLFLIAFFAITKIGMSFFLNSFVAFNGSYTHYLDLDEVANMKVPLLLLGLLIVRLYFLKGHAFDLGINKLLTLITVVGCIFYFCGVGYGPTGRLFTSYAQMMWLILPNTLYYIRNNSNKFLVLILFAFALYIAYLGQFHEMERFSLIF